MATTRTRKCIPVSQTAPKANWMRSCDEQSEDSSTDPTWGPDPKQDDCSSDDEDDIDDIGSCDSYSDRSLEEDEEEEEEEESEEEEENEPPNKRQKKLTYKNSKK